MLHIIDGNLGSGKTLFLVAIAFQCKERGIPIVSNFTLYQPLKYKKFSLKTFIEGKYSNCVLLLDEIYTLLDSRNSMRLQNKVLSYELFQSRKNGVDIYGTLQLTNTLDLRFRELADSYIQAYNVKNKQLQTVYFKYRLHSIGNKSRLAKIPLEKAKTLFRYYDTFEVIDVSDRDEIANRFKTKDEKINDVKMLAQEIMENYDGNITHNDVKSYLFNNKKDMQLEKYVYVECKKIQKER